MNAIGGYFELADYEEGIFPHQEGVLLNTGRNALEYILRSIGDVKRIFLPFFTCDAVLEPLRKLHIPWSFYHIDYNFEVIEDIKPQKGEYVIVNNYFGIKDSYILQLADRWGETVIVDNAQAMFAPPIPETKSFYSMRKFVGVADGGVAYMGNSSRYSFVVKEKDSSDEHNSHLFTRKIYGAEAGFKDYQENEKKLNEQPIRLMSDSTESILKHIDYDRVLSKRIENFKYLHRSLAEKNALSLPEINSFKCPMVYPFIPKTGVDIHKSLIDNKIYVAKYWPSIDLVDGYEIDYQLSNQLIPVPCDQRYGETEMNRISGVINEFYI